ncbi:hypothetical protein GPECTOR_56g341 [Gonium pectorale]|uniref:NAD(+) kinase n=1 Tax=Gonium pectorale TaxID=33097 RepID=A0A150G6T3_GONPE|nr:hypothetical protein GPECTOR_56g341 [Gonium pectorale]|eukprot:KXZ45245.1 hypothetical protein GPECTOR_56g341 [Gonium pectorale]
MDGLEEKAKATLQGKGVCARWHTESSRLGQFSSGSFPATFPPAELLDVVKAARREAAEAGRLRAECEAWRARALEEQRRSARLQQLVKRLSGERRNGGMPPLGLGAAESGPRQALSAEALATHIGPSSVLAAAFALATPAAGGSTSGSIGGGGDGGSVSGGVSLATTAAAAAAAASAAVLASSAAAAAAAWRSFGRGRGAAAGGGSGVDAGSRPRQLSGHNPAASAPATTASSTRAPSSSSLSSLATGGGGSARGPSRAGFKLVVRGGNGGSASLRQLSTYGAMLNGSTGSGSVGEGGAGGGPIHESASACELSGQPNPSLNPPSGRSSVGGASPGRSISLTNGGLDAELGRRRSPPSSLASPPPPSLTAPLAATTGTLPPPPMGPLPTRMAGSEPAESLPPAGPAGAAIAMDKVAEVPSALPSPRPPAVTEGPRDRTAAVADDDDDDDAFTSGALPPPRPTAMTLGRAGGGGGGGGRSGAASGLRHVGSLPDVSTAGGGGGDSGAGLEPGGARLPSAPLPSRLISRARSTNSAAAGGASAPGGSPSLAATLSPLPVARRETLPATLHAHPLHPHHQHHLPLAPGSGSGSGGLAPQGSAPPAPAPAYPPAHPHPHPSHLHHRDHHHHNPHEELSWHAGCLHKQLSKLQDDLASITQSSNLIRCNRATCNLAPGSPRFGGGGGAGPGTSGGAAMPLAASPGTLTPVRRETAPAAAVGGPPTHGSAFGHPHTPSPFGGAVAAAAAAAAAQQQHEQRGVRGSESGGAGGMGAPPPASASHLPPRTQSGPTPEIAPSDGSGPLAASLAAAGRPSPATAAAAPQDDDAAAQADLVAADADAVATALAVAPDRPAGLTPPDGAAAPVPAPDAAAAAPGAFAPAHAAAAAPEPTPSCVTCQAVSPEPAFVALYWVTRPAAALVVAKPSPAVRPTLLAVLQLLHQRGVFTYVEPSLLASGALDLAALRKAEGWPAAAAAGVGDGGGGAAAAPAAAAHGQLGRVEEGTEADGSVEEGEAGGSSGSSGSSGLAGRSEASAEADAEALAYESGLDLPGCPTGVPRLLTWRPGCEDSGSEGEGEGSGDSESEGGPELLPSDVAAVVDFVVVLGGDGTVLWTCHIFGNKSVPPVVPFNMGSLGFLTPFDPASVAGVLEGVLEGGFALMLRHRLHAHIVRAAAVEACSRDGSCSVLTDAAASAAGDGPPAGPEWVVLNEVVIDRGISPFLTNLECYCDGAFVTTVQVPANSRAQMWCSFDGKDRQALRPGDAVIIRMSAWPVPTVCSRDASRDWFSSVREGLHWNLRRLQAGAGQ